MQMVPMMPQNQSLPIGNPYSAQTMMVIPGFPGNGGMPQRTCCHHKQKCSCKKHKKKKKKKSDSDSDSDSEYFYVRRPVQRRYNGDVEKKVVYREYGGGGNVGGGGGFGPGASGRGGFGGGVVGGGRRYEIFAPSHPQAVNQYVKEYNYNPQPDVQQPGHDYLLALQQYKDASAQYQADRINQEHYATALERYSWALEQHYAYDGNGGYDGNDGYDGYDGYGGYDGYDGYAEEDPYLATDEYYDDYGYY